MDAYDDDHRNDGRRSASRDSRTARIELAQRRLESALATPNSPSSPWSARSMGMGLAVGSPTTTTGASHSPAQFGRGLRSVSFSSEPDHRFPGSRRTEATFPSTFEDNESEASFDEHYFQPTPRRASPTAPLSRSGGGLYASIGANGMPVHTPDGTRSRSQSLATLGRRPLPSFPSSPLPAPGSQGLPQSWADSRFGIPAPIHNSHNFARPAPRQDLSNISPFVRDVGQIFTEDPRDYWPGDESGAGGGSGTTSRRHSVSVVQPRTRFNHAFAQGQSVISDDDLLGNMLNLDLDDSTPPNRNNAGRVMPATFNPRGPLSGGGSGLVSQPSSLPNYPAPLQRHSPVGALGLHENSPRASTLDYVPEDGTSWRQNQNPSPERSASGGFVSRPSLSQLRTDSLRAGSGERGFSPSLSPNTQRFGLQSHPSYGQERTGLGLGLTGGAGYGAREPQSAGPNQTQFHQNTNPGASPRAANKPFPVSPSAMRTSFGPSQPLSPGAPPPATHPPAAADNDLGRGLPLSSVPPGAPLYVVEFKAGRTDLFFTPEGGLDGEPIRRGDLVIVEADRGKDLGKVVNDSISLAEVERFMMEGADDGQGGRKEIMPKRIYGRAGPGDTQ